MRTSWRKERNKQTTIIKLKIRPKVLLLVEGERFASWDKQNETNCGKVGNFLILSPLTMDNLSCWAEWMLAAVVVIVIVVVVIVYSDSKRCRQCLLPWRFWRCPHQFCSGWVSGRLASTPVIVVTQSVCLSVCHNSANGTLWLLLSQSASDSRLYPFCLFVYFYSIFYFFLFWNKSLFHSGARAHPMFCKPSRRV